MNLFEQASRVKLRFASTKGELTVEQLWDAPLISGNGFNLDVIAKDVNTQLKASTEESFVKQARPNAAQAALELKLEILKHIIGVKLAEADAAKASVARAEELRRLKEALAHKQDEALMSMDADALKKRIEELSK